MYYIVGLGNPGGQYEHTRHNVGWAVLDHIVKESSLPNVVSQKHLHGRSASGVIETQSVTVLYPETFMNLSGTAVKALVPPHEIHNLIVIHDDIDLPFGEIKLGKGRGDGGNNGIKSIIASVGTKDFIRIRVGIAPKSFWTGEVVRPKGGGPLEKFVLKPFTKKEEEQLMSIKENSYAALKLVLTTGLESAMNKFN